VILSTGTFLKGLVHVGLVNFPAGRAGDFAAMRLSDSLRSLGFSVGRLKTGTTPRIDGKTIDFSKTTRQDGDERPVPFSFDTEEIRRPQVPCWLTYTNEETHQAIRSGLSRSPLYTGVIRGIGPRYCPSIEDKVVRFPEKGRHQVFLEPEGLRTAEYYPNGIPTSLPYDVQVRMVRTIPGLERAEIVRPGYAIEYDFVDPVQLYPSLETKILKNLYHAGQINGTSGYEEAAAQGLLAGINAARRVRGEAPVVLSRADAYIGVLIDDLVTCGVDEPYRMFTSRAEYRLLLRQDNADRRLTPWGRDTGLVDADRALRWEQKEAEIARVTQVLQAHRVEGVTLAKYLQRPEIAWADITARLPELAAVQREVVEQVVYDIKYAGYVMRQQEQVARQKRLADRRIPENFDYSAISHLRTEARQKLARIQPVNLAQASRISGVTPADLALLLAHLEGKLGQKSRDWNS